MGCHFLLQSISLTQELNPHLLHWQADSLPLNHLGSLLLWIFVCISLNAPQNVLASPGNLSEMWTLALPSVSSVAQSCPTLCNPMDSRACSTPGLPIHHQLLELAQTQVHRVSDAIQPSSSVIPFSSGLQSFPASGSFPMSQFFATGGQSTGASASASVLLMNIQDWFPLGWTGLIFFQSRGLSRVFSNTTVQKH